MAKKALVVFGTRPEAVKMAPVIYALRESSLQPITCVTAQHRDLLDQVLAFFRISPDYDLNLMVPGQDLESLTIRAIKGIGEIIRMVSPNVLLCQGDTTTAFAAALAAFYQQIPIGHVEAGLRTYDRYNPFPEEINRQLISVLATFHFAPTELAKHALISEGKSEDSVFLTGNPVIDALKWTVLQNKERERNDIKYDGRKIILVTTHRRESFGESLESICMAIKMISERNHDIQIVFPVHPNPQVREPVNRILENVDRISLIDPLPYDQFIFLMNESYLILTDSGGLQEEAPALGKPVLVMRDTTERPEAIEAGVARLVGTSSESIFSEANLLLNDDELYRKMAKSVSPFGNGTAAVKITQVLENVL